MADNSGRLSITGLGSRLREAAKVGNGSGVYSFLMKYCPLVSSPRMSNEANGSTACRGVDEIIIKVERRKTVPPKHVCMEKGNGLSVPLGEVF